MPRHKKRRKSISLQISPKVIWFFGLFVCVALIFVSYRYESVLSPIRNIVGTVVSPMQRGINGIGKGISEKIDNLVHVNELLEENAALKAQVESLSYTNKILSQEKYELDILRSLYELDQKYADYPKVAARIIAKDTSSWYNVFRIDKGTDNGLAAGMNVLSGNGLVGIITAVEKNNATVRSIIDDKSNVSAMALLTQDTCIVSGDLTLMSQNKLKVSMISMEATVSDGYEIVTSHISEKYLPGILIGYLKDIEVDSGNMTRSAYLTPAVDFAHLEEVLVITQLKDSYGIIDSVE